uniref:Uncharacterized protein n=1 Tax=Panagrolaimus superbus TaxID=310955 RepID=A0A914YKX4_9BILA
MNSGEQPRRTEEEGVTVPRTDPSSTNIDKTLDKNQDQPVDMDSYPNTKNDDTLLNNMKDGVKHAVEKAADGVRKLM